MTENTTKYDDESRWKSMQEIWDSLQPNQDHTKLATVVSLHTFLTSALHARDYSAHPDWANLISPTAAGILALQSTDLYFEDGKYSADAMMALFIDLYHHDLYIDHIATKTEEIISIVSEEIRTRKLVIPHRFGRLLYDKFNDQYEGDRTDHLLADESLHFLQDTPQGVYQVGPLISGPLGLIQSPIKRFIPPSLSIPLWHCSDVGCRALHDVDLLKEDSAISKCLAMLRGAMDEEHGPYSEWGGALTRILEPETSNDPFMYSDLGPLIADTIHGEERTALLTLAISGESGIRIRTALKTALNGETHGQGSAETISNRLSELEQLQLLYLLTDSELVQLIDLAVKRQLIRIPSTEIRASENSGNIYSASELSSLGVRCSGSNPLIDLCALIWEAYTSSDRMAELEWHLRNQVGGTTARNALLTHLCQCDPALAVKELVLSNGDITRFIASAISCPIDETADAGFIDRVLWKLGFDIPRYSDPIKDLRRRLDYFRQELLAVGKLSSERDRERIRSAGVNLFVSIEEFLQELIRYNVWVLSSDHFLQTKFTYEATDAMKCVGVAIGEKVTSGNIELKWNATGENTLGVLLAYLQATSHWMKGLITADRTSFKRDTADLPHYADRKFRLFPFQHTALWADADYHSLKRIYEQFESICSRITLSKLAYIRNGLDHHRDELNFPNIDQMLAFDAHFREGLDFAEANLFYPMEHWIESRVRDRHGRTITTLLDYSGRQYKILGPSLVHGTKSVLRTEYSTLIAPGNPLGHANTELAFMIRKQSIYSEYWKDYPRRRKIPSVHKMFSKAPAEPPTETLDLDLQGNQ